MIRTAQDETAEQNHFLLNHIGLPPPTLEDSLLSESVMDELPASGSRVSSIFLWSSSRFSKRSTRLFSSRSVDPVSEDVMSDDEVLNPDLSPKVLYPLRLAYARVAAPTTATNTAEPITTQTMGLIPLEDAS